jgi:hypothetical protein
MVNSLGYHLSKKNEKKIDRLKYKVIVFVLPEKSKLGVQRNEIRFPFKGEVHEITASCVTPGDDADTMISIERIPMSQFEDLEAEWIKVADNVTIPVNRKQNNSEEVNIIDKTINEDDYVRVVVDSTGEIMRNITVEVVVKLEII